LIGPAHVDDQGAGVENTVADVVDHQWLADTEVVDVILGSLDGGGLAVGLAGA
jgi:hypothetical protein